MPGKIKERHFGKAGEGDETREYEREGAAGGVFDAEHRAGLQRKGQQQQNAPRAVFQVLPRGDVPWNSLENGISRALTGPARAAGRNCTHGG